MNKTFLFTILLIFTISLGGPAFSQDTVLSKVKTGNGFHSTDFRISDGILTVYLPSDMTVNETASGTMILKGSSDPNGFNQIMSKYNLVVENQNVDIIGIPP